MEMQAASKRYELRTFEVRGDKRMTVLTGAYDTVTGTFPNGGWLCTEYAHRDVERLNSQE
jgi:hypothetical protein